MDINRLHLIDSLGEALEAFDKDDFIFIYFPNSYPGSIDGYRVKFKRSSFASTHMYNQYVNLINEFGVKLQELSKSHIEQLQALK